MKVRLKNVKGAKEKIEASSYIIKDPETYKGKYQTLFFQNNPIHLEIGMGKGDFIIKMAKKYPNINFIGIEMFDSVMVRACEKLENEDIPNLKLIKMDAGNIENVFSKEISCIYLNFSDPWPKKRHAKRRLTSENFLNKYDKIFKKDKIIIQKTDNRHLFEYSLISFVNHGYKIAELSLDLTHDDIENETSEYEEKFIKRGLPIYMTRVYKDWHVN